MARTLPWLANGQKPTTTQVSRSIKPTKRQKTLDPSASDDNNTTLPRPHTPSHNPITSRANTLRPPNRTPSTSPPPAPPQSSPLRPGLEHDDIYIMVEDEFLSTARTFTAHLHHAEYQRLKRVSAKRDVGPIVRPVDTISAMREETKRKKAAQVQEARTRKGVEGVLSGGGRRRGAGGGSESESESGEEEGGRGDDPWRGTHLQRFMTTSPKMGLQGLTGLEGVRSSTRAAAGYERGARGRGGKARPGEEESDDDDDLDAPTQLAASWKQAPVANHELSRSKQPHALQRHTKTHTTRPKAPPREPSPPRPPPKRAFLDLSPITKPTIYPTKKPPPLPTPHSSPPESPQKKIKERVPSPASRRLDEPTNESVRRRLKARREREREKERKREAGNGGGGGVEEIPVFIV